MSFPKFVYMTQNILFSNFARFCTPERCTRVHCLVLKNNPEFLDEPDTPLTFECPPPGSKAMSKPIPKRLLWSKNVYDPGPALLDPYTFSCRKFEYWFESHNIMYVINIPQGGKIKTRPKLRIWPCFFKMAVKTSILTRWNDKYSSSETTWLRGVIRVSIPTKLRLTDWMKSVAWLFEV